MPSDFLDKILERKRMEVEEARREIPEDEMRRMAEDASIERRPFFRALAAPGPYGANIIAEVKRASPSKGPIRPDLDPAAFARKYQAGGAAAMSVLTDRAFFSGSIEDLQKARGAVELPVIRKDFLISFYQIYESAVIGADAVLLIARAMPWEFLRDCLAVCGELELDALVEVHSERELEDATRAGGKLIGINNRDLSTFRTDIENSIRIGRHVSGDQVVVAESGIRDRSDIERLCDGAGICNFLIGESLVRASDPEGFLKGLLGRSSTDEGGRR